MQPIKVTFDGMGLNDANDPYKRRLFTLASSFVNEGKAFGEYAERAINNYQEAVDALGECLELLNNSDVRHYISTKLGEQSKLHRALKKSRKLLRG